MKTCGRWQALLVVPALLLVGSSLEHAPHEERPDLFLQAVRDFLQTLPER